MLWHDPLCETQVSLTFFEFFEERFWAGYAACNAAWQDAHSWVFFASWLRDGIHICVINSRLFFLSQVNHITKFWYTHWTHTYFFSLLNEFHNSDIEVTKNFPPNLILRCNQTFQVNNHFGHEKKFHAGSGNRTRALWREPDLKSGALTTRPSRPPSP